MTASEVFIQQIINGLSNGMIIALIALGYTMVYGIVELINFAHGGLFMLGSFFALTLVGALGLQNLPPDSWGLFWGLALIFVATPTFCAALNWSVDRFAYRHLRQKPRLVPLVSAIGVSFVFMNLGQFWGGVPMQVFADGKSPASPQSFPLLVSNKNIIASPSLGVVVEGN